MRVEKDFEELLGLFHRNKVKYCKGHPGASKIKKI